VHPVGGGKTSAAAADAEAGGPLRLGQPLARPPNACRAVRVLQSLEAGEGWHGRGATPLRRQQQPSPDILGGGKTGAAAPDADASGPMRLEKRPVCLLDACRREGVTKRGD
jgi:hypothetical protein